MALLRARHFAASVSCQQMRWRLRHHQARRHRQCSFLALQQRQPSTRSTLQSLQAAFVAQLASFCLCRHSALQRCQMRCRLQLVWPTPVRAFHPAIQRCWLR